MHEHCYKISNLQKIFCDHILNYTQITYRYYGMNSIPLETLKFTLSHCFPILLLLKRHTLPPALNNEQSEPTY